MPDFPYSSAPKFQDFRFLKFKNFYKIFYGQKRAKSQRLTYTFR